MDSPAIRYVYRCRNRRCKSFKKELELAEGPTGHVKEKKELPRCPECQSALKFVRMNYPKEVFRNPHGAIDLSLSQDELLDIIKAADKTVSDRRGARKPSSRK